MRGKSYTASASKALDTVKCQNTVKPFEQGIHTAWGAEIIFSPTSIPCYREATLEDFRCPDLDRSTAWHQASPALPHFSGIQDLVYSRQGCADQRTVLHKAALGSGRSLVICSFRSTKYEYLLTLLHTTLYEGIICFVPVVPWRFALTISYLRCVTISMLSQSKETGDLLFFFFQSVDIFQGQRIIHLLLSSDAQ